MGTGRAQAAAMVLGVHAMATGAPVMLRRSALVAAFAFIARLNISAKSNSSSPSLGSGKPAAAALVRLLVVMFLEAGG